MESKRGNESIKNSKEQLENDTEKEKNLIQDDDLLSFIKNLNNLYLHLRPMKNVNKILTKENFDIFNKASLKNNIKINLLLSKIYMNIISKETLYNDYLTSIEETDKDKIDLLFKFIENCISIIKKLNSFVISSDLFMFKNKILDLLQGLYFNCKTKIKNEEKIQQISELMDSLPAIFFSDSFLELNKSKELYQISSTKETDKIATFEEKFSTINNYFEQFEIFKKFIEYNSGSNFGSIDKESINKKTENYEENENNQNFDTFYTQYGTLILKFCKYHMYMFLDKDEEEDMNREKVKDEDNENKRVIFLVDKNEEDKNDEKLEKEQKIQNLLKNKQFISLIYSKEYKQLIQKEINYYLKLTNNMDENPRIKLVREHLLYYLRTLDVESFYPLYLRDFTHISINDNFTPSFFLNISAGSIKKLYFETPKNEDTFVYIEFSLEDTTKNIDFELNKYDAENNKFLTMFKEQKVSNCLKFLIFCKGEALYEIVFDNYFSWFNSKDINYRISLLKLKKEDEKQYEFIINGKNYCFNKNEIIPMQNEEEDKEKEINISIIMHLNTLKIYSFKKDENIIKDDKDGKTEGDLFFKEYKEEEEKIIPKHFFNYLIINYLKKLKIHKNKEIKISIFSHNNDLLSICEDLKEQFEKSNSDEKRYFLKNIGFLPDDKIDEYNFTYLLYDWNEQILFYHIYLSHTKNVKVGKTILLMHFENSEVNAAVYNKGEIYTKLKGKKYSLSNISINNIDKILYLIKNVNDNFDGLELIIDSNINTDEENKIKESDIEKIKKYCLEIINPPINIVEYEKNDIYINAIKYIDSFVIV